VREALQFAKTNLSYETKNSAVCPGGTSSPRQTIGLSCSIATIRGGCRGLTERALSAASAQPRPSEGAWVTAILVIRRISLVWALYDIMI
jgi:hypothetical protein